MRVAVDDAVCTGHGRCYVLAPDLFGPDEFGHSEVLVPDGMVPADLAAQAYLGRDNCPERAIVLADKVEQP